MRENSTVFTIPHVKNVVKKLASEHEDICDDAASACVVLCYPSSQTKLVLAAGKKQTNVASTDHRTN